MKGFELDINGEKYYGALPAGSVSTVILTRRDNEIWLDFGGLEKDCIHSVDWIRRRPICEEDRIAVRIADIENADEGIRRRSMTNEQMLAEYNALTEEFKEKGWI